MATIKRVNEIIATFADGKTVRFLDLGPKLLGPDGIVTPDIMPDFLHPTQRLSDLGRGHGKHSGRNAEVGELASLKGGSPCY